MSDPVADIQGVVKTFRRAPRPALQEVSARIPRGVVTGLAGPDGAGKTTLMRLLAGLLTPTEGTVRVLGLDPFSQSESVREDVGYMPQKFGLYEDLRVRENLELHADLRGLTGAERSTAFERLLRFTDLERFQERLAGRLSGGMKQKLGLACALLGRPKVLLLDEPGVGVDPISRRELWRMVQELVGEGLSVVWSTSYLEEAERCAQVLLLSEGRLLFAGPPPEITDPLRGRCLRLRAPDCPPRRLLARGLRAPGVMDGVIQGHSVRLLTKPDAPPVSAASLGLDALEVSPAPPRFEDAFLDALGASTVEESVLQRYGHNVEGSRHEVVVEVSQLTRKFGSFTATDNVSFAVKRGEIFGLLGPNGAGKSTTFRMLCGLLRPSSGTARVMGIDLQHSASRARQRLGYMAQKFSLYGDLTVRQNLQFFSGAYGLRGAAQEQAMEGMTSAFHLGTLLDRSADSLPLGFKQRLSLACALMHEPDILFLDEPTSGVDPVSRREFWGHINALVEKGVTIVVTTHFMEEAEYCDRIALIFRGRVIAAGTPDQLKALAASPEQPDPSMEEAFIGLVESEAQTEAAT
jgi:ABC-2 type transport system ATP-binding protein